MSEIRQTGTQPPQQDFARGDGMEARTGGNLMQPGGGSLAREGRARDRSSEFEAQLAAIEGLALPVQVKPVDLPPDGNAREGREQQARDVVTVQVQHSGQSMPGAQARVPEAPHVQARVEAIVERISAEMRAGAVGGVTRGPDGAVTLSFPLSSPDMGLSAITLSYVQGRLTVTVKPDGKSDPDEAALRDLAHALSRRFPGREIRMRRDAGMEA